MADLTPDHPAVKAAVEDQSFGTLRRLHGTNRNNPQQVLGLMRNILRTAIRNLTADDIRDTDVAEEIRTEGWMQGWAAGRDLDGDEDATKYLRHTPAGRALMAEGWDALIESMSASGEFHDVDLRTMQRLNPYRGGEA